MSCPSLASRKELKRHQKHEATGQLPPQAWGVWEIGSLQACRASCTLLNFECGRAVEEYLALSVQTPVPSCAVLLLQRAWNHSAG
ncbi:hypothetical protein JMJ77_0007761 [Colletotrichum scovillei]|uniref:Uncharacterized protein n=1 Tax=Colletotrichum scovillei TaxID=1209932 RepID=A0A9P7UFV2_9PEZI|nr:hypothetical protein JMJ77_0007761 [Colletotrichum scovillei]KAG7074709.1 hypothetical protein JMJ76_0011183 [Colletotrichum scovillei]KAG7081794.1 hypothetical protein JMJ78_0003908 [Colletotrichum scovillei]